MAAVVDAERIEEHKRELMVGAFIGWQRLSSNGYKEPLDTYYRKMGLIEKEKISKEDARLIAEYAKSKAAAIVAAHKRQRSGKQDA